MGRPSTVAVLVILAVSAVFVGTASAIKLNGTSRGLKSPTPATQKPLVRTTPKYMREFVDGNMDEEESDPITSPVEAESQKQAATKPPKPAKVAAPAPEPDANTAVYTLLDSKGSACILFKVDALLTFRYKTVHNEDADKELFVPNNAAISGDCGRGDDATLIVTWQDFEWTTYFTKTPGGERWYIEKIELSANTGNSKAFEHIKNPGRKVLFTSGSRNLQLFPTPVGKSYTCTDMEKKVTMSKQDITLELELRDVQVQPFIFRKGEFGPEFVCSPAGASFRDETAPIAVGSTLAIVVLCTITGYGAFRYFKIKKVQYDTME